MTEADLYTAIQVALGTVPYAPPISVAYCIALRDDLRTRLPGASIEAYHRLRELVVDAQHEKSVCKVVVPLGV